MSDVGEALRLVAHFTLDAQGALIANLLEGLHESANVDFAMAQGDFFPQFPGVRGRLASLTCTLRI